MAAQSVQKSAIVCAKSLSNSKQHKTHRRSRTGCFTCRLRRKKCDEGKPGCKACRKLNICCDYKRPMWWGNAEQRRNQKEIMKIQIKALKVQEKQTQSQHMTLPSLHTSPNLYHSPGMDITRSRGPSAESSLSDQFDFNAATSNIFKDPFIHNASSVMAPFGFQPFNDSVKIETEWYLNDVNVRRDSTITTSFYEQLPPSDDQPLMDSWIQKSSFDHQQQLLTSEPADLSVFDLCQIPQLQQQMLPALNCLPLHQASSSQQLQAHDRDQYLLDHFQTLIAPNLFPMLELAVCGARQQQLIDQPLNSNRAFFHAALACSALNIKLSQPNVSPDLEADLTRHVAQTVTYITTWLSEGSELDKVAEAALAMIYLNNLVAGVEQDSLCELPWDSHFAAARDTLNMLEPTATANSVTIASWIDILGATMTGDKPAFADLYRDRMTMNVSSGLSQFLGCDDKILYLISEIASLESAKYLVDNIQLCMHIASLGDHINTHEELSSRPGNCHRSNGSIDGNQLRANVTHIYRLAARIYLCSLVPDFDLSTPNIINLVQSLTDALDLIPMGPHGYDRSLVWPLLMAGVVSRPGCKFRTVFAHRVAAMDTAAGSGAFLRMYTLLHACWTINDDRVICGEQNVHWRDVMQQNDWKFLLI